MASILDMSASSDSEDDVDYVPPGEHEAATDSSCDEEDVSDGEIGGKTKKLEEALENKEIEGPKSVATAKDEKQRAKELWESFLSDVDTVAPKKSTSDVCNGKTENQNTEKTSAVSPQVSTKPVPDVFEFAGETVILNKDLKTCDSASEKNDSDPGPTGKPNSVPMKRGIDSVLNTLMNKNKKLSVLEKTAIDWKTFKKDEGLENDLGKYNKGKQGFVERQRFLERSDLRSFEMEKAMRQTLRKK